MKFESRLFIDTHTHFFHKRFDMGREEILKDLANHGVLAVVECAIDFESNQKMKLLCEKYPHVFMAAGCHPNCVEEMDEEKYQAIADLLDWGKVLAVGETGLDYARKTSEVERILQKTWFHKFIELAIEKQKPLVIHCREAYDDVIRILQEYQFSHCPGVIHCFSGNIEQAQKFIDMGFYIGVNGMFTKMDADSEVCLALKTVPLEKIIFETDSPYLLPKGVKGKRNTSKNMGVIMEEFAKLRGISPEYVSEVVLENTKLLYPGIV